MGKQWDTVKVFLHWDNDQHHEGLSSDIGGIEPKDAGSQSAVMGQYGTDDWIYPILVE